ncbi:aminotransferase class III-fold pyridoxal phosphate-dependent enzyme [Oscillospiraceae bacterium HV4-5-C5C]|nr:aminotransferase class III-fold pyridoxal phosphate-dependent enzyme [Oscillospiraceae bacterium HV4-5-C5C]
METQELKQLSRRYVLQSWSRQRMLDPIPVDHGEGLYFWDLEGRRYSDMSSQLVNLNLGFNNPAIVKAIQEQAARYCFISPAYASQPRAELAEKIIRLLPDNMAKVFFTNAGADANENAIKMARMYTGRYKIFSRYRSYHGSTFGAGNLTGEPRRFPLEPGIPGFIKFFDPYVYREKIRFDTEADATAYYLAKLREQLEYEGPSQVAAIVVETITGSNGVIIPPEGYLPGVRQLCDEYGILLICDEVMAGFGRTGKMFAFEHFGIKPDLVTFAKGVTCGYVPLGGVAVSQKIAAYFDDHLLSCGLTYSGHPLACAAGCACVDYYAQANILDHVQKSGAYLKQQLLDMKTRHRCVGDVRAIGLFAAVELVKDQATREPLVPYGRDPDGVMPGIIGALKKRGFMTYSHENMILVAPPLIITCEQLAEELPKLDAVLSEVDAGL